jgi:hypothetical protein
MTYITTELFKWDRDVQPSIDEVERSADADWLRVATDCIRQSARDHDTFTSDEVIRLLSAHTAHTHNLMALGPVFQKASQLGIIINTGKMKQTTIRIRHRKLTVWRSLLRPIPLTPFPL